MIRYQDYVCIHGNGDKTAPHAPLREALQVLIAEGRSVMRRRWTTKHERRTSSTFILHERSRHYYDTVRVPKGGQPGFTSYQVVIAVCFGSTNALRETWPSHRCYRLTMVHTNTSRLRQDKIGDYRQNIHRQARIAPHTPCNAPHLSVLCPIDQQQSLKTKKGR